MSRKRILPMKLITKFRHWLTKDEMKASEERLNTYQNYLEEGELPDREGRIASLIDYLVINIGDLEKSVDGEIHRYKKLLRKKQRLESQLA